MFCSAPYHEATYILKVKGDSMIEAGICEGDMVIVERTENAQVGDIVIAEVDVAYLDGSFFEDGEIPGRDMSEIPHPFIRESMARFSKLPAAEKAKVRFIHLNRTNPALVPGSDALQAIAEAGFAVASELEKVGL